MNFNASELTSGIYVYKIRTAGFTSSKKMMLLG
ncbi:MAG: T9SS type A sorting domain-containing protein [Ignavibacteria bacterium]|nr:T9SS type A sorting domain-containing protein [Ignavibacteria bacterium]